METQTELRDGEGNPEGGNPDVGQSVEIDAILSHLSDPRWRIENLYSIQNEAGQAVKFRPNRIQGEILDRVFPASPITVKRLAEKKPRGASPGDGGNPPPPFATPKKRRAILKYRQ
jgi:hypothetical protein